jgi:hypothetical protein
VTVLLGVVALAGAVASYLVIPVFLFDQNSLQQYNVILQEGDYKDRYAHSMLMDGMYLRQLVDYNKEHEPVDEKAVALREAANLSIHCLKESHENFRRLRDDVIRHNRSLHRWLTAIITAAILLIAALVDWVYILAKRIPGVICGCFDRVAGEFKQMRAETMKEQHKAILNAIDDESSKAVGDLRRTMFVSKRLPPGLNH